MDSLERQPEYQYHQVKQDNRRRSRTAKQGNGQQHSGAYCPTLHPDSVSGWEREGERADAGNR